MFSYCQSLANGINSGIHDSAFWLSSIQSTESRKNVYRAIVQVQPPYLNNIYLATQVRTLKCLNSQCFKY